MRKAVLSLKLVTLAVAVVLAGMMPAATCLSARPTLAAASGETQAAAAVGSSVDRFPAAAFASLGPSRRLLRGGSRVLAADMRVSIANFAALPAGLKGVFNIPGIELAGSIQAPAGALGSREATELANILAAEMKEIAPADCQVADELQFPGANVKGKAGGSQAFPTVWAPFRSGWIFRTAGHPEKPGAVLHFSNFSLVLPKASYAGIRDSGFMDYLDLGQNGYVCFTNSVLVLASCDGFAADTYKMWCCTATSCDIVFTQSEVDDLGIGGDDPLEHIPCITAAASTRGFTP